VPITHASDTPLTIIAYDTSPAGGTRSTSIELIVLPVVITLTTSFSLTSDIQAQIVIGADSIALKCNGHSIIGITTKSADPLPNNGITLSGRTGVLLHNCNVFNFYVGIQLTGSSGNTLVNNVANSNSYGVLLLFSTNNNFHGDVADRNSIDGYLISSANGNTFTFSSASNNGATGFDLISSSGNNFMFTNAYSNTQYGFAMTLSSNSNFFLRSGACQNGLYDLYQNGSFGNVFVNDQFCRISGP
jgi:parallel beta-helix repeat protein